jgi:hypothetical protein
MNMDEERSAISGAPNALQQSSTSWPKRAMVTIIVLLLLCALTAIEIRHEKRLRELSKRIQDIDYKVEWQDAKDCRWIGEPVNPEANVIQFLKRGYSIQLERVSYEPAGLHLIGYLGNPLNISLYNVSLKISARKSVSFDDYKKSYALDPIFWAPEEIGNAQTAAIAALYPGQRAQFDVTIPNVRQTKDQITLYVSFAGERYGYLQ